MTTVEEKRPMTTVKEKVLAARIQRRLQKKHHGMHFRIAPPRQQFEHGRYWIAGRDGMAVQNNVDIIKLAKELGCFKDDEILLTL